MFPDRDFDPDVAPPCHEKELIEDLGLNTLFDAMAADDPTISVVARSAIINSLTDADEILYRQAVLRDCIAHPSAVRTMYETMAEVISRDNEIYRSSLTHKAGTVLKTSVRRLALYAPVLRKLRSIAEEAAPGCQSQGFVRLFRTLVDELDDEYLSQVQDHLDRLKFKRGALISARIGEGNKGTDYVLRKREDDHRNWITRLSTPSIVSYTYRLNPRDIAGGRAFDELRTRGMQSVANATSESADHILDFFRMLRTELAFYVGCLNVRERLVAKNEPICFPTPCPPNQLRLSADDLYDVCMSLATDDRTTGNAVDADGRSLIVITGANQGGKSTFVRGLGIAQLMTQCGLFAPAVAFTASMSAGVFTHYKREEDVTLTSGKLDEELARMSAIADHLHPGALVIFNESFAATNEREGSEIARQIIRALCEHDVRVVFVTHQYDLASSLYNADRTSAVFLRAERRSDGRRTFKLTPGAPLPTSYGHDLYEQILTDD